MAGGAAAQAPNPLLIVATVAVFIGFTIAYGTALPSLSNGGFSCSAGALFLDCFAGAVAYLVSFIGIILFVVTLGGVSGTLPPLVQGPILLIFGIAWGPLIAQSIANLGAAVIP